MRDKRATENRAHAHKQTDRNRERGGGTKKYYLLLFVFFVKRTAIVTRSHFFWTENAFFFLFVYLLFELFFFRERFFFCFLSEKRVTVRPRASLLMFLDREKKIIKIKKRVFFIWVVGWCGVGACV